MGEKIEEAREAKRKEEKKPSKGEPWHKRAWFT